MCIILSKPLEDQIENTGITSLVCYKIFYKSNSKSKDPYKTPYKRIPLELNTAMHSHVPLLKCERDGNLLQGGIHTLFSIGDALKYITLCGMSALGTLEARYNISVAIVSGIIPENTNYVQGTCIDGLVKCYSCEAFKPVSIIKEFSNTPEGRMDFYNSIRRSYCY